MSRIHNLADAPKYLDICMMLCMSVGSGHPNLPFPLLAGHLENYVRQSQPIPLSLLFLHPIVAQGLAVGQHTYPHGDSAGNRQFSLLETGRG